MIFTPDLSGSGASIMLNPYMLMGIILTIIGFLITPFSYYIVDSVSLAAVGLSTLILGFTSLALASTKPGFSTETCQLFLKMGVRNATALLEVQGRKSKAVYYPRSMRGGNSEALIPIIGEADVKQIKSVLPENIVDIQKPGSEGVALAVTTPGNISLEMLERMPGATDREIEAAINDIIRVLDIANRVKVEKKDSLINIYFNKAKIKYEDKLYFEYLGSPLASIAAVVCSEALEKPVRIIKENCIDGNSKIVLEALF